MKKKIFKFFFNIITSGTYNNYELSKRIRLIFLNSVMLIGLIVIAVFTMKYTLSPGFKLSFYNLKFITAFLDFSTGILVLIIFFYVRYFKHIKSGSYAIIIVLFTLFTVLIISGEMNKTALVWILVFPTMTIFLLGLVRGAILSSVILLLYIIMLSFPFLALPQHLIEFKYRIIGAYVTLTSFTLVYEYILEKALLSLKKANKKNLEISDQKINYLINLAHETKTPLTLINNYMDIYIKKHGTNNDLEKIRNNLNKLTNSTIDFLDYDNYKEQNLRNKEIEEKSKIFNNHNQNIANTKIEYNTLKDTILIVEDNTELVNLLRDVLSEEYNVFKAVNGKDALNIIHDIPIPDLIISDIMMDQMDGIDFYKKILTMKDFRDTPFIFLTAKNKLDEQLQAFKLGAIDFVSKPFSLEILIYKIKAILNNKKNNIISLKEKLLNVLYKKENKNNSDKYTFENKCILHKISQKEKEIIKLVFEGLEHKEIADKLTISISTVKTHMKNIYRKTKVQNKIELLNFFN